MSKEGALFLATFVCELAHMYHSKAKDEDLVKINQEIYKWALTETLYKYCRENLKKHGRLTAMKQFMLRILVDDEFKLSYEELALFQLRDFCWDNKNRFEEILQDPRSLKISANEAVNAMDYR